MAKSSQDGYIRLHNLLAPVVKSKISAETADDLLDSIIVTLQNNSANLSIRAQLLAKSNNKPECWLCGLRIFLDEPLNSDASFSIDHVKKKANGGQNLIENVKPAHRFCNSIRHTSFKRNRVKKRLESLKKHIFKRLSSEKEALGA